MKNLTSLRPAVLQLSSLGLLLLPAQAIAHDVYADDHAPIGVMADHAHKKGEIMFSARLMHMEMRGNQIGSAAASADTIATTTPNRFFGAPMQPPTLRIVPDSMRTDMIMVGAMYAPSDAVTLAIMGSYIEKEMDHITYQGGIGTNRPGGFRTSPKGIGDITVSTLFPLLGHPNAEATKQNTLTLKTGISIPVASTTKTGQILTPMGTTPSVRLPYPMQIGSGTWDLKPGITYKARRGRLGFGIQYAATLRLGRNRHGYALGDTHELSSWISYRAAKWISFSGRVKAKDTARIGGIDPSIMGPVQTANPNFHGGQRLDMLAGVNMVSTHGALAGHRLGLEFGLPIYQNLNGPQLTADWSFTLGWQKAF